MLSSQKRQAAPPPAPPSPSPRRHPVAPLGQPARSGGAPTLYRYPARLACSVLRCARTGQWRLEAPTTSLTRMAAGRHEKRAAALQHAGWRYGDDVAATVYCSRWLAIYSRYIFASLLNTLSLQQRVFFFKALKSTVVCTVM